MWATLWRESFRNSFFQVKGNLSVCILENYTFFPHVEFDIEKSRKNISAHLTDRKIKNYNVFLLPDDKCFGRYVCTYN